MNIIAFEILLIFVLLLLNGVFSMSELAIVSARRVRLEQQAEKGNRGARVALGLAENPSRFLSTVQTGITLVGILAGAFGGATIAEILAEQFSRVAFLAAYANALAFASVVAVITYFSIIIGELIPKSVALNSPEKVAVIVARPMRFLSIVAAPLVWLLTTPTAAFLRLFRLHASVEPPVTDEEIKGLVDAGTKAGVFEESEQDLIESVIHLNDRRVTAVMTPRTKIQWLDLEDSPEKIKQRLAESLFSRLPVGHGSLDNLLGYASAKHLLGHLVKKNEINLTAVLRQPLYVPETATVLELLEQFRQSQTHFAVLIDEHGGVEGIVTMNDVLEEIVGELPNSQHNLAAHGVERRSDGSFVLDGRLPIFEFEEVLGLKELPLIERGDYQTLAGFVIAHLGNLPRTGDRFRWDKYEFEVISMERNRIDKVLLTTVSMPEEKDSK